MTSTVAASRGGAGSRSSSMASPQQRPAGYGGGVSQAEDRNAGVPRSSFMQVPLASQSDQLARGRKVFEELSSFAKEKYQVEDKTAHAITRAGRLGAAEHELSGGTLQQGLLALRRFSALESRQHSVLARQMQEQFHQPLEQAMTRHADFVMRAKIGVQRSAQLVQEAEAKLTKAKKQLSRAQGEEKNQRAALARVRRDPRASQKDADWVAGRAGRAIESARQTDAHVSNERHQLLQALRARDDAVAGAARHFELAERERASSIARALHLFAMRQREFYASQLQNLDPLLQAVEALDPDRDVDGFIERRRNPENAPLYGVALCLLDWAMVDSGRDSIAKSQTQQQQKQQAEKRQGGVGAGEAARSIDSRGVGEARPTAFAQPHAISGDTERDIGELVADAVQAGDDDAPPTLAAMSVPVATAIASIDATSNDTSNVGGTIGRAGLGGDVVRSSSTPVSTGDGIAGSVTRGQNNVEAGGVYTPAAAESGNRNDLSNNSTEHALDAKIAIERHLRNLIPDQQQTQRQRASTNHDMNDPATMDRLDTAGNRADAGEASVPRAPKGAGAFLSSPDNFVSSTNPFSSGFLNAGLSTAAPGGGGGGGAGARGLSMNTRPSSTVHERASVEGLTETVWPGILSSSRGDSVNSRDEEALSGEGTGDAKRESARAELKMLVASEKGRGHFLQALNERRSEATEVTPEAFDVLVETLRVFLDGCLPGMRHVQPGGGDTKAAAAAADSNEASPAGAFIGRTASEVLDDQGLGTEGNGAGDNKAAESRDGAQSAHAPTPHTPSTSRSVRPTSSTRQPSPSSGGHFFPARKRGTISNWSGLPQSMTDSVGQASAMSPRDSVRAAVGNSPVRNRQRYHPQHPHRQPSQQQEQQMRMKAAPYTAHLMTPQQQQQQQQPQQQQQQQQQPENTPVAMQQEPSSQIEANPATDNVVATSTAITDTAGATRLSFSMPLPSPSSSPPPAPFTPSRQPQTPQQQPQPANFFELAASVIGVRPMNSSPSAGGGNAAGPGAAGFVNDPPSTPGPNNNNPAKFNGSSVEGGGSAKRTFGSGGGFAGGFAGGLAGDKQTRAGRWGFGGGGSGGRDSGGVRQPGGMDRYAAMLDTVEAALGRGRTAGGAGVGVVGVRGTAGRMTIGGVRVVAGGGAEESGDGEMDIRSARQAMILANTFFKTEQVPPSGESTGDTIVGIGSSGRPRRTYLLRDLRDHDLWKHPRFWDEALMLGVKEQLQEGPAAVRWDDLQGEARRDAVARTHNVVFSQLASIAFNMLECGVDSSRVHADVTRKCKESQLGEVQVQELLRDLDRRIRRSSVTQSEATREANASIAVATADATGAGEATSPRVLRDTEIKTKRVSTATIARIGQTREDNTSNRSTDGDDTAGRQIITSTVNTVGTPTAVAVDSPSLNVVNPRLLSAGEDAVARMSLTHQQMRSSELAVVSDVSSGRRNVRTETRLESGPVYAGVGLDENSCITRDTIGGAGVAGRVEVAGPVRTASIGDLVTPGVPPVVVGASDGHGGVVGECALAVEGMTGDDEYDML